MMLTITPPPINRMVPSGFERNSVVVVDVEVVVSVVADVVTISVVEVGIVLTDELV